MEEPARKHNYEQWYKCQDCEFIFTIHKRVKKIAFCPNCGETFTRQIKKPKFTARDTYREWEKDEMELLEKVINKELQVYQVALLLNRSRKSVANKAGRIRRSRG